MSNELEQRALDNAADDHDRRRTLTPAPQVVETVEELEVRIRREIDQRLTWPSLHWDLPDWDCRQGLAKHLATVLYPHPTPDVGVLAEVRAFAQGHLLTDIEKALGVPEWRKHEALNASSLLALINPEPTQ